MSSSTPEADPFGAAPFDPERMRRHKHKQDQLKKQLEKQQELTNNNLNSIKPKTTSINPGKFDFWH